MSTLRINNIEAQAVPASPSIDEKIKLTNSSGDVLVHVDGKTSGITTIGINTTAGNIKFDQNSNVVVTGIITATKFVGTIEPTNLTVSGDLTIPDKIIHSGDTNTTIRFPAADTITAETGGSEKLRIASNGYVGIGTATPDSILNLFGTGSDAATRISIKDGAGISNIVGRNGNLTFQSDVDGAVSGSLINFAIDGSEKLRITSDGFIQYAPSNMQIFADSSDGSDNHYLNLSGGGACTQGRGAQVLMYGNEVSGEQGRLLLMAGNSGSANGNIKLYAGGGERMRITSTDATLYGTTDGVLNLDTSDSRGTFIRFKQGGSSQVFVGCGEGMGLGGAPSTLGLRSDSDIRIRTGAEEHATITTAGYFAAKGEAGNWIYNRHPSNDTFHQFSSSKNGDWMMQFRQEHANGLGFNMRVNNNNANEAIALYRENQGNYGFKVYNTGNVQNINNSYGSLSDVSLKENIVDAKSQWDDIKAIKVRNFNLKSDTDKVKMLGVVAQELETVSPHLVFEDKDGVKGVHYSILYMKAIKALQESQARIQTLEAKVAALEGS